MDELNFQWARTMGLFSATDDTERFRGIRVGWLAGRTSPRSTPEGLQLLADWQMWLFAFDDAFCDESATGDRPDLLARTVTLYLGIIEEPQAPPGDDPFAGALADVPAASGAGPIRCSGRASSAPCPDTSSRSAGRRPTGDGTVLQGWRSTFTCAVTAAPSRRAWP